MPTQPSGTVEVHVRVTTDPDGTRCVEFVVRDHGGWLSPPTSRGNRGHGMTIMRACDDEVTVDHTPAGTTIILRGRPLPARLDRPRPTD